MLILCVKSTTQIYHLMFAKDPQFFLHRSFNFKIYIFGSLPFTVATFFFIVFNNKSWAALFIDEHITVSGFLFWWTITALVILPFTLVLAGTYYVLTSIIKNFSLFSGDHYWRAAEYDGCLYRDWRGQGSQGKSFFSNKETCSPERWSTSTFLWTHVRSLLCTCVVPNISGKVKRDICTTRFAIRTLIFLCY